MDDSGDVFSGELQEASLKYSLRALENEFFKGIAPLARVEIVSNVDFPARYVHEQDMIELDAGVARFPRKLALKDPTYTQNPYGAPYRAEVRALCKNDAYIDLL
jgi:hypothetical protein